MSQFTIVSFSLVVAQKNIKYRHLCTIRKTASWIIQPCWPWKTVCSLEDDGKRYKQPIRSSMAASRWPSTSWRETKTGLGTGTHVSSHKEPRSGRKTPTQNSVPASLNFLFTFIIRVPRQLVSRS